MKKVDWVFIVIIIFASFSIGFFAGQSFTPFNRALRKAQELTRRGVAEKEKAVEILTKQKELLDASFKYAQLEKERQIIALSLANVLIKYEMWNEALKYLDIAREILPGDYAINYNYAFIYYNLKKTVTNQAQQKEYEEKALSYLEIALNKIPESPEANYLYGAMLYESGNIDKAAEKFLNILKQNPNEVRSLFALARIYYDKKDYTKAKKLYLKLQQILPKNSNEMEKVMQNLEILNRLGVE
ncbi:MAG: tetratricopeptide repeat protein [Brevinematales bacterium]|nr:tetratricopeptide repeat protein [Brevinematales bacterium]